jgi:hypothetical protein
MTGMTPILGQDVLASIDVTTGEYQTPELVVHCATIALRVWPPIK